jgi:RNA 3'-terminal phosphate cyclase (ATP)
MARACADELAAAGLSCAIERVGDSKAVHAGASLAVWATTSSGCILGADRAGAPRRTSEAIGRFVAAALLADLAAGATTDRHAADQLLPFAALAAGRSSFVAPAVTDHVESNLWLAAQFGARVRNVERRLEVDGIGFRRKPDPAGAGLP